MLVNLYVKSTLSGPGINEKGKYLWLLVYKTKEQKTATMEGYGSLKNTTEYRLELTAIVKALRRIKACDINLYTDCPYIKNYFNCLDKWSKNGWNNGQLKNVALWVEIWCRTEKQQVKLYDLKGSSYAYWMDFEIKKLNK